MKFDIAAAGVTPAELVCRDAPLLTVSSRSLHGSVAFAVIYSARLSFTIVKAAVSADAKG